MPSLAQNPKHIHLAMPPSCGTKHLKPLEMQIPSKWQRKKLNHTVKSILSSRKLHTFIIYFNHFSFIKVTFVCHLRENKSLCHFKSLYHLSIFKIFIYYFCTILSDLSLTVLKTMGVVPQKLKQLAHKLIILILNVNLYNLKLKYFSTKNLGQLFRG